MIQKLLTLAQNKKRFSMRFFSKTNSAKKFHEIDMFKGIAIIWVLIYHYIIRYDYLYGHRFDVPEFLTFCRFGVDLFFMTCGFLVLTSLERISTDLDFLFNRFSRLYPAYWFSVIFTFCFVNFFTLPGKEVTFIEAIVNLSMLQDWIPGVSHVDGSYWALSRFLSFYFIIFFVYKMRWLKRIKSFCIVWIIVIVATKGLELFNIFVPDILVRTFLLKYGNLFIIGIIFYRIKSNGHSIQKIFLILTCLLLQLILGDHIDEFISVLCFVVLFYLFVQNHLSFLYFNIFIYLGEISYSLYLIHQNVGYVIIRVLYRHNIDSVFLILFIPTITSIALAVFITFYIERPSLKILRKSYKKAIHIKR